MRMNEAQKVMIKMGVNDAMVFTDKSLKGFSPSFTKKGPGRKHKHGVSK